MGTTEALRCILVPFRREVMRLELHCQVKWYNEHRPDTTLGGRTPNEEYFKQFPANRKPRIEPRPRWPRASPSALPQSLIARKPGDRFTVEVAYLADRHELPIITLRRAR